jgi:membrane protease YdiL (CAAX protease family)
LRYSLRKFAAIAAVVTLTFIKIFPFSSQLFGALGALAFGAAAGDGRVRRWFRPCQGWPRTIAWGIVGGLAVFATDALLFSIYPVFGLTPVKLDRFAAVHGNLQELLKWLALIWLLVGITEELISRAFLIDQWQDLLPVGKTSTGLAVTLSALTFGAVHSYQGLTGVVSNFVAGSLLGALYVLRSRTLPSNVIAHALADSFGLLAIYFNLVS